MIHFPKFCSDEKKRKTPIDLGWLEGEQIFTFSFLCEHFLCADFRRVSRKDLDFKLKYIRAFKRLTTLSSIERESTIIFICLINYLTGTIDSQKLPQN